MEGVYILSDNQVLMERIIGQLSIPKNQVLDYESFDFEHDYHDWITRTFKNKEIKKLIVPLSIASSSSFNSDGLKFILHYRLNYELSIEQRCIPIILLSDFNLDIILAQNNFDKEANPQNLFFTKGIIRSFFDPEEIAEKCNKSQAISEKEYFQDFLNRLKITRQESEGKHSIANAWGCFKVAQVIGLSETIMKDQTISTYLKTLFAENLICNNKSFEQTKETNSPFNDLECSDKKILFIDDQGDEGWNTIMHTIFKSAGDGFEAIDSGKYKNKETKHFHDFEGFYAECQSHIGKEWDLIIIDLRLNPLKEDIDNEVLKPTEFSGYKLIDEFLTENEGYQIIVSTASNKIWNVNAAMKRGAVAYYIKESPEFNYPLSETRKQLKLFKKDIKRSFKKKNLWHIYNEIKQIKTTAKNNDSSFHLELPSRLEIAWQLLKAGKLDFSFLTLFQIVESYASTNYDRKRNSIYVDGKKKVMIEKRDDIYYWQLKFNEDYVSGHYFTSTINEVATKVNATAIFQISCILKFAFNQNDDFLRSFGQLNEKRNKIAHGGSRGFVRVEEIMELLEIVKMVGS